MQENGMPARTPDRHPGAITATNSQSSARVRALADRIARLDHLSEWDRAQLLAEALKIAGTRNNGDSRCPAKGCAWRGTCPTHSARFPKSFRATEALMRRPANGHTVRVVR